MSSYSRIGFLTVILFLTLGCAKQQGVSEQKQINPKEDLYMLLALDSETQEQTFKSSHYYQELYKLNKKQEYIIKAIGYSFKDKNYSQMETLSNQAIIDFPKSKEYFTKQLIVSMISLNKLDVALEKSLELLKVYPTAQNYEIVANVYYAKKDFQNSVKYYESSYVQKQDENTLVKLTTILYTYLNQKDVALAYLETYLQTKGCSSAVCDRLMLIYQEQGNIDGMLSILNRMHTKYKQNPDLEKTTLLIENIIISLLEKKDIKEAIKFLEENNTDRVKLLNLYYQDGQLEKALKLTRQLYKTTRSPELLGRIAMIEFELAPDKQKVMKHVIANFELALSSGINNASYQNYYGYLLIDFDLDIEKGVSLVEQALKTAPNNLAYLDSLAWGYYKLGRCSDALDIMTKVIQVTGLQDEEIKKHWETIQNCKGKK